ncbi:MAG: transposase [Planctomycetota bacterium]|nr:transposase [Planctomycetota bacterium]
MALSAPIVDALFDWAREERERALPKSPVGKALGYMLNQEVALRRFLEDGALEIDNNDAERGLRQAVTGRKNYLRRERRWGRRRSRCGPPPAAGRAPWPRGQSRWRPARA